MGDFFKSLNFNYFNNTTSNSVGDEGGNGAGAGGGAAASGVSTVNTGSLDNDYVGQIVDIAGQRLRTKCVIAEGIIKLRGIKSHTHELVQKKKKNLCGYFPHY